MDFHRNSPLPFLFSFFPALLLALAPLPAHARITDQTTPVLHDVFTNPDCRATDTCSLKRFEVEVVDYKAIFDDDTFAMGPSMVARYRTDQVASLRDYLIVQFIHGCIFASEELANGSVERRLSFGRDHYGKAILFQHPEWVIDSSTTDPGYWADPARSDRHYSYLWNRKRGSTDRETAMLFGQAPPRAPELYVTDLPTGASSGPLDRLRHPTNASLEFETCIYRTADVSRATPPSGAGLPSPIHCVHWASSQVFNHARGVFESPQAIEPFCLSTK